jgi:hypothetical protein
MSSCRKPSFRSVLLLQHGRPVPFVGRVSCYILLLMMRAKLPVHEKQSAYCDVHY